MFTGIIEEIGSVEENVNNVLKVRAPKVAAGIERGHSVAVNGVCLTVSSIAKDLMSFEVMERTAELSGLLQLARGSRVNLERAARPDSFLGGHIVQGHVDGIGTVQKLQKTAHSVLMTVRVTKELSADMVAKGSVAVDGASLTIAELSGDTFTVSLVPTTLSDTVLGQKKIGDTVNIETDILGKYAKKYLGKTSAGVTEELLKKTGFMK